MAEVPRHDHQVDTGKSVLSFDELGAVQPGMARLMPSTPPPDLDLTPRPE